MKIRSIVATAIGAIATVTLVSTDAQSNARVCRQLQAEARELDNIRSGASRASLTRELRHAEGQVRRSGCRGLRLIFGGHKKQKCGTLRSNVQRLQTRLRNAGDTRSADRRLRHIKSELRRSGCGDRSAANSNSAAGRNHTDVAGHYRTLCVRKCDGYYFPIGFATVKEELKRDKAACEAFYPENAAQLYVYRSRSADPAEMVSLNGDAYSEQPFAFAYRSAYQPACANLLRPGVRARGDDKRQIVAIDADAIVPIPVPRPTSFASGTRIAQHSSDDRNVSKPRTRGAIRTVGPVVPYLVSYADEGQVATTPDSPPRRVAEERSFFDQIASIFVPEAQAEETAGGHRTAD